MQFTDCQRTDNHYYSLSDRTDRNVAFIDCISASILDNPQNFIGQTIQGDARAFQSSLKLELFDLLRSTINLPVTQIFYFLPHVLTQMSQLEKPLGKKCFEIFLPYLL